MSQKTRNIIGWVLTGLLALVFLFSASMKLMASPDALKAAAGMGLSPGMFRPIGVVELLSLLLFIIPRTGLLGTLLLAAYLGGAMVTHLEHQQSPMAPIVVECIVWITAAIRFPELTSRILKK